MIEYPQRTNKRSYSEPQTEKKAKIPDGTELRCPGCSIALVGIFNNNQLEIKHRGWKITMKTGEMDVQCPDCSFITTINLKRIKVNYIQQDDQIPEITNAALELAKEEGVKINNVVGSGRDGKIVIADVRQFILDHPRG